MIFALASVPLMAAAGAGVDLARSETVDADMQAALDATALALVQTAPNLLSGQLQTSAQSWFNASFHAQNVTNVLITAQYDAQSKTATVSGSGTVPTSLLQAVGMNSISVGGISKAGLRSPKWPICVMVTSPASNHTLLTQDTAKLDFQNCMVQVNTQNWDAVEARNSSYIHSANGENCFVGDIHYGDILPPKDASCTFFTDPFANYAMPSSTATCTYTNKAVTVPGTTLTPGTYCGGLNITKSATLNKGVYIIRDGDLKISGSGTVVTGDGVTFLFTGLNTPGFNISSSAVVTLTPASEADAGIFGGFVFYFDQATAAGCVEAKDGNKVSPTSGCVSLIQSGAKVTLSGIVYLIGQAFIIDGATVTVNPGTLVADFILPQGNSVMSLTGTLNTATSAEIALQKAGAQTGSPVLIR